MPNWNDSKELPQIMAKMDGNVAKDHMYDDPKQCKAYEAYRPRYTEALFKAITDYCKESNNSLDLAVDVGCGPGMSTFGFATYFKKVLGVDPSEAQLSCARKDVSNVEFKLGYSDKLPFIKDRSVDLFCSGESFNLMPREATFAEADRVLKPGGTIALFGYNNLKSSNPVIDAALQKIFFKLLPYWPKETQNILDGFRSVKLPYADYTRNDDLRYVCTTDVRGFMGLLASLFPVISYKQKHPEENIEAEFEKIITDAAREVNGPGDLSFETSWDLFILMGHKPKA